jgi:CO/xanthine dehydrogenase FAD-binding subunit
LVPVYYGGGSEIITMSRAGSFRPGTVIDLKGISDCNVLELSGNFLSIGATKTLNEIKEAGLFPLLGTACGRVADHTNQCRITLGGNLCGSIIYRETSLPLMLADAEVDLFGKDGERTETFNNLFRERIRLQEGEFIVRVRVPVWALHAPYLHVKKTTQEKIYYPLVNVTALKKGTELRAAFSGVCGFPFRSAQIERIINNRNRPAADRAEAVLGMLPEEPNTDTEGTGAYRLFVLKNTLLELLEGWGS